MTTTITTSIIILSHNRVDDLRTNLPVLLAELPQEIELIVVDNASIDGSREFLKELQLRYTNLRILFLEKNMGVPGGRNAGFRVAKGEYIVALDDDAYMSVNDIRKVPDLFSLHENAGILAFSICDAKTGEKLNNHANKAVFVGNYYGAAHAIRKKLFDIVGYMDEDCKFGAEEFDFSVRCHAAGYKTIYLPEVQALHNSISRPGSLSVYRCQMWIYGFVRTLCKHFPMRMAYLFSFRYTIQNILWHRNFISPQFVVKMFMAALQGRMHGRMVHSPVPVETVKFYSDPTLPPQYGNVPLNLLQRFSRKVARSWRRS